LRKAQPSDRVEVIWDEYMDDIYRKVADGQFDMIIISPWEMRGIFLRNPPPDTTIDGRQFLQRYYYADEKIELSMTNRQGGGSYQLQVWRPRKSRQ